MTRTVAISLLLLISAQTARAGGPDARAAAVRDLVAVENAFAQLAADQDWIVAFKTYFADDGLWFVPQPERTQESLAKIPSEAAHAKVEWYPTLTDASGDGALGFNLGPYTWSNPDPAKPPRRGYFFTIWTREAGQPFRVAIDFGAPNPEGPAPSRSEWRAVRRSASAVSAVVSPDVLRTSDAELCAAIRKEGLAKAYARYVDRDTVLLREGGPRTTAKAIGKYLEGKMPICPQPQQSHIATSGDLGYTYGSYVGADAASTDAPPAGYYVHVWRKDGKGRWRLAVDVANTVPPAPR
jgi:ketosteroid isomerase-like protein